MSETTPQVTPTGSPDQGTGGSVRAEARDLNSAPAASSSSRRQAFKDLRRQLSNEDLASPGVQKMLLDELERAEEECELARNYIPRFYEADKRAAILEEKQKPQTVNEIMFGVGLGLGGAIIGVAPVFWDATTLRGQTCLVIGAALVIGAVAARWKR